MRFLAAVGLLVALPVSGSKQATVLAVAQVVHSVSIATEAGDRSVRLTTATRAAGLVQVGAAAPLPVTPVQTIAVPKDGTVVVTLLY